MLLFRLDDTCAHTVNKLPSSRVPSASDRQRSLAIMFSRNRKPLTQPQGDPSEPDAKEKPSQHRQKIKLLRSLPIIRNIWLLFQEHKREPFTWVLLAYFTTLLLAANTLKDPHAELVSLRKLSTARAPMIKGTIIRDGLEPIGGDSWLSLFFSAPPIAASATGHRPEAHKKHSRLHFHQVRKMSPRDIVEHSYGHRLISTAREKTLREHPISTLIREAEVKARQIESKINSIESYADAVEDYKNAFGMEPPRGFQGW
ncbi:hypothetical protein QFC22_003161 [Naganishia vaughanmartiniae]|uniref:Uncharacterized protein n=1 Tax=Naganishia vaughanmartiniae TaxID=1424756 RepID=A0ACC2X9F6_9TREE|nr:hypothetical protein QFC22_003161 [Naganishia vaughanmartiniae]